MPVIFISYRRDDSAGHAGRLYDRLRGRFGNDHVFLDVVGIDAGVDFVETLDKAVGACDVLLAVIGREWLTCRDKQGRRRLDDPNDFIRAEISVALQRNVRVVPVLVQGAEMPTTGDLPADLKRLTRRQAVELRDSRWDADVEALIAALEREAARTGAAAAPPATPVPPSPAPSEPTAPEAEPKRARRGLVWGLGAVVALLIAIGLYLTLGPREESKVPPAGSSLGGGPPQTSEPKPQSPEGRTAEPQPERQEDGRIEVPNVVGADLGQAKESLRRAGFEVSEIITRLEPSAEAKNRVLSQEPAAGSRIEKGTRLLLVGALGTTVTIHFLDEADRAAAEGLAKYLGGLNLPGVDYEVEQSDLGLGSGRLLYSAEGQADLARTIAYRSSVWLSQTYGRSVQLETEHDHNIGLTSLWLLMPASGKPAASQNSHPAPRDRALTRLTIGR